MCIYFNSHKNWEGRSTLWDFAQAENSNLLGHGSPTFLCQRATPVIVLLLAGSRAARGKITISGRPKCLNYCKIFIVFFFPGATQPIVGVYFTALYRALASSHTRLLDHTQRRATVRRTPLNE